MPAQAGRRAGARGVFAHPAVPHSGHSGRDHGALVSEGGVSGHPVCEQRPPGVRRAAAAGARRRKKSGSAAVALTPRGATAKPERSGSPPSPRGAAPRQAREERLPAKPMKNGTPPNPRRTVPRQTQEGGIRECRALARRDIPGYFMISAGRTPFPSPASAWPAPLLREHGPPRVGLPPSPGPASAEPPLAEPVGRARAGLPVGWGPVSAGPVGWARVGLPRPPSSAPVGRARRLGPRWLTSSALVRPPRRPPACPVGRCGIQTAPRGAVCIPHHSYGPA
jgi:hypothetical protein